MIVAGAAVVVVSEPTRVGSLALGGDAAGPIAAGGRSPLDLMERALRPLMVPLEPDWCRFAGPMSLVPNRMPLGST